MSFVQDGLSAPFPVLDAASGPIGSGSSPAVESAGALETSSDSVRRLPGMCANQTPACNAEDGILAQLLGIVTQLLSMIGFGTAFGAPSGNQTPFQTADGSSSGDPHLAFSGTTANGTVEQRFDSMTPHPDLVGSDSFGGGYIISTSTTQPNAAGVTFNQQATVTTDFGNAQVSVFNTGNAQITQNGMQIVLADGQSYALGNGEVVSRSQDGTVTVADTNAQGGNITTTLRNNGNGVDVSLQARNVDLGGDLVGAGAIPPHNGIAKPVGQRW